MRYLKKTGFGLLLLLFCLRLPAQTSAPIQPEAPVHAVSNETWTKASKGLDYSKDLPKPPKKKKERPEGGRSGRDWSTLTQGWGTLAQVLAIALAILAIGYGIYYMLRQPRNRQISRDGVEITLDNIEDYLHETDLEKFLRLALADGNYAQAVRLYYLQVIKDLSARNDIRWAREKTNRDYLRDMRQHRLGADFRQLTFIFERVWYGNIQLRETEFRNIEPDFKRFLGQMS